MGEETSISFDCWRCRRTTNHNIKYVLTDVESMFVGGFGDEVQGTISYQYRLLQCMGCSAVTFEENITTIDNLAPEQVDLEKHTYPKMETRARPNWKIYLPKEIRKLLEEVYSAEDHELYRLAGMGIRTLIEEALQLPIDLAGGMNNKLDSFMKRGLMSETQRAYIETVIEMGHAVVHRKYEPSAEKVAHSIEIAENLLHSLFVQPNLARWVEEEIPKRR